MSSSVDPSAIYTNGSRYNKKSIPVPPPTSVTKKTPAAKPRPQRVVATQAPEEQISLKSPPSLKEQLNSLISEADHLDNYRDSVHSDDNRLNRLEIQMSPGLFSSQYQSNYSFRNFSGSYPYLEAQAYLWFTPDFGLKGKTGTSFGATIDQSASSTNQLAINFDRTELALSFRHYFGLTRKAKSLSYGIYYLNEKVRIPSDSNTRSGSETSGIGLFLTSRFPVAPTYSWTIGTHIVPRLKFVELSSDLNLVSGDSPQGTRVGLDMSTEFKFSRQNQLILGLEANFDRIQFTGSANTVDPISSQTPSGVSLSHSSILFNFGYRWGL